MKLLVQLSAGVNVGRDMETAALLRASVAGHAAIVRCLVDAGADVNDWDYGRHDRTVLWSAADRGDVELVQYLLQHGADVNDQCGMGLTALKAAAEAGNECLVRLLALRLWKPLVWVLWAVSVFCSRPAP